MATIDADAHVIESDETWRYIPNEKFRPFLISPGAGRPQNWLIDGRVFNRGVNFDRNLPVDICEMRDIKSRLKHMDQLDIDVQVLYPSLFLRPLTARAEVENAICRSYNRWLIDVCARGEGRLKWIAVVPVIDAASMVAEVEFAKANGACGVFMRGIEGERMITDPYFYPLYEEMSRLDLAVGVHVGNANPYVIDLVSQYNGGGSFWKFRIPIIGAFHSVIMSDVPTLFPKLRFHWAEAAAQWIPYVVKDFQRRWGAINRQLPDNPLKEYRQFVSCQTDDDVDYVLRYSGEDNLVIGTDYGHNDQSTEIEALRNLKSQGSITPLQYEKITYNNAKELFAL